VGLLHGRSALWRFIVATVAFAAVVLPQSPAGASAPPAGPNCVANPPTSLTNAVDVVISDNATAQSTIAVSGLSGQVLDVDVTTRIVHPEPGDLDLKLIGPSGKVIDLSIGNATGAANAFNGTTWDDDADPDGVAPYLTNDGLVTDHNYVSGNAATPLVPQEALAALVGDAPNGTWTLSVTDVAPGDTGVIDEWGLTLVTGTRAVSVSGVGSFSNVTFPIPDGGTVQSQVAMTILGGSSLEDLQVTTQLLHDQVGDLQVTLTSPAGTVVTLTSNNAVGTNAFQFTRWSIPRGPYSGSGTPDPVTLTLVPPFGFVSALAPEESFGAFVGENPQGIWTLTVSDTVMNGATGTLNGWSLSASTERPCQPGLAIAASPVPANVGIGTPLVWQVTAQNSGIGYAPEMTILGAIPNLTRVLNVTPSTGGSCLTKGLISCTWPGNTPPGASRTATVRLEPYIVGTTMVKWTVKRAAVPGVNFGFVTSTSTPLVGIGIFPSTLRAGNDRLCTVLGTAGPDVMRPPDGLLGHPGVYCGLGGDDRMIGGEQNEVFDGGPGRDVIEGGGGRDDLSGGAGADVLRGGEGRDVLRGGAGGDRLTGGAGRDLVIGGAGVDQAFGAGDRYVTIERLP
jgi:subtilisin-like proprotein convertase family protein